jgi:hypothetical protein
LLEGIQEAFPALPVPKWEGCVDETVVREDDLLELKGRSWLAALDAISEVDPSDAYLLTTIGLGYYLPFFISQLYLNPDGNASFIFPEMLSRRIAQLEERVLGDDRKRGVILGSLRWLLEGFSPEEAEPEELFDDSEIRLLQKLIDRIEAMH